MTNRKPLKAHELRAAIIDFALENEDEMLEEMLSMTDEEVNARLVEDGIDPTSGLDKLDEILSATEGQLRINIARQKLNKQKQDATSKDNWAKSAVTNLSSDINVLKAQLRQILAQGSGQSLQFRGYENATVEDLQAMIRDAKELKEKAEEDAN